MDWGARRMRRNLDDYRAARETSPTRNSRSPPRTSSPPRGSSSPARSPTRMRPTDMPSSLSKLGAAPYGMSPYDPNVVDVPPELWWDTEVREALRGREIQRLSRSRSRSTSPNQSPTSIGGPQDPFRPIGYSSTLGAYTSSPSSTVLGGSQDPVLVYKRGGDYFPVDEEYHLKRVVVRGVLERAEHRKHALADDHAAILKLRDEVQAEYQAYAHEVHARCSELRAVLEMRESMLMGSLEKLRTQKVKSLAEDAAECRSALDRLQHLCGTIGRMMDQERESEVFLAKMAIPEMQLRETLDRADEWVPEVQVSFGAKLEIENSLQCIQSLDFSYPQEIRGAQGSASRPTAVAPVAPASPPLQSGGVNKIKVLKNIDSLISQKNEAKARYVAAENFIEAAKIKKEVDALEEEKRRVARLPDEPTVAARIEKLKAEKKMHVQNENFSEADRCKQEIAVLQQQLASDSGGGSTPAADPPPDNSGATTNYKFRITTSHNTLDKDSVFYDKGARSPTKDRDAQKRTEAVTEFRKRLAEKLNTNPSQLVLIKQGSVESAGLAGMGSGVDVGCLYFDLHLVVAPGDSKAKVEPRLKKLRQTVDAKTLSGTVIKIAGEDTEMISIKAIDGVDYKDVSQLITKD